jgi:hypothetical protein
LLCVCLSTSNAKARSRYYAPPPTLQAGCSDPVLHPCVGMDLLATQKNIVEAGPMPSQSIAMRSSIEVDDRSPQRATSQAYGANEWRQVVETPIVPNRARSLFRTRSQQPKATRIGAIVSPLAAKVREISSSCGSSIVSSVRHTHIANTRTMSLHASGQAVDMRGNPRCIYQHLSGWPGGYSIDYGRVQHVHISYSVGGREWGLRFAHGGQHRHGYAHRHRRYASR